MNPFISSSDSGGSQTGSSAGPSPHSAPSSASGNSGAPVGHLGQPGHEFLTRVRRATAHVLGDSPAGREVLELCDQHAEARRMILEDRSQGSTVIAVVGATGQGKSWLIRQLVRGSAAESAIRSGNNLDEATEKLVWVGPFPPADLDLRNEQFIHCSAAKMQSIGMPYLLVDAPGATDDRPAIAAVARRALSMAGVLLLMVRREQLRSETVAMLTEASEGTIVIPVVNAVRNDSMLDSDIDAFVARMRKAAPTSRVVSPVIIQDYDIGDQTEAAVGQAAAETVAERLQTEIGESWEGDRRRSTRLSAMDARFRSALNSVLGDRLPDLTAAVRRLNDEARKLPLEVAESLVGSGGSLQAAVRSRLRLSLLNDTAAFWFPYRTQLGILNLTHGAWDRVLMSLSGSLPSLVSAVWTSTKNLTSERDARDDVRDGLRKRSDAAVADRLGPLAIRFRDEVAALRDGKKHASSLTDEPSRGQVAYLSGIDTLQERSQRIFEDAVDRVSISRTPAILCGLIGTAIFWFLMAGPVIALYRGYFDASYATLRDLSGNLDSFPRPDFAMMLTSLILSVLPTALFAMIVLSVAQSRSRVRRAELQIRDHHHDAIEQLQRDGVLRLRWDEPLLADAEFLLSAGAADTETT
ncbi:hypothetical protein K227x_27190 [Rubripirellula lacrimiformis]|uniref:Uncharacterized protein n=1 Tax=Rubripirellula lacrimiformis TaxID=1930273 RepID=A0A517NB14_9BACT|nr:GTPase [Rubripirellula lacrimiformis]QDT04329.1 hypothetical protein K227x_27190 [Rubripirellula lacrimiformis]